LQFNLVLKSSVKSILLFFFILIIQIVSLAAILIFSFKIELRNVLNSENIPDLAKYLYLGFLYFFMLINLYLFDSNNFLAVFNLSKIKLINFAKGFLIAFISLLVLYFIEVFSGIIGVKYFTIKFALLTQIFIFSFIIALIEELLFRNFIFRKLKEDFSLITALIVSGYIYGQLHFLKFDISLKQIILPLTGLFFIGIILAFVFYHRDLWFSIGMHTAWIILISYTTQESLFMVNPEYSLLTGGYYPIGGVSGIFMAVILLYGLKIFLARRYDLI
jgi:membrane protease YdiL (CAAX protease family)